MKTFKHKVIAGQYASLQAFQEAYTNHVTDWHNTIKEGTKISIEKFLGVTDAEYNVLFSGMTTAYASYLSGDLFNIPSVSELDYFLSRYKNDPAHTILRFGQYVYNNIHFEFENSYNEKDTDQAYNILKQGIEYWSIKEEND